MRSTRLLRTLFARTRPCPRALCSDAALSHAPCPDSACPHACSPDARWPPACHPESGLHRPPLTRTRQLPLIRSSLPELAYTLAFPRRMLALYSLSPHYLGYACMQTAHRRKSNSSYHFVVGRNLRWLAINSETTARRSAKSYPPSLTRSLVLARSVNFVFAND